MADAQPPVVLFPSTRGACAGPSRINDATYAAAIDRCRSSRWMANASCRRGEEVIIINRAMRVLAQNAYTEHLVPESGWTMTIEEFDRFHP